MLVCAIAGVREDKSMIRAYIIATIIGLGLMAFVLINGMRHLKQSDAQQIVALTHTTYPTAHSVAPRPSASVAHQIGPDPFDDETPSYVNPVSSTTSKASPVFPNIPANAQPIAQNSYVEKTETIKTATAPTTTHYIYVHKRVKYHHGDKVHVARAAKHTTMFALKLPARMAL